jgi:RNA polymerase sigma-70 factor (ECF subfamily)
MYRVAGNAATRTATRKGWGSNVTVVAEVPEDRADPSWDQTTVTRDAIRQALAQLPEDQREVLLLAAEGRLTYGEIAETLVVAEGTVKARVSRARARLAVLMDGANHA